jgi:hypothetical protein
MKKSELRQIIKEEISKVLNEAALSKLNWDDLKQGDQYKLPEPLIYSPTFGGLLPKSEYENSDYKSDDKYSGERSFTYEKKGTVLTYNGTDWDSEEHEYDTDFLRDLDK